MIRHEFEYRGWKICIATETRRKVFGHAAGIGAPCKVLMAEGWGAQLVLKDLKRQIDDFEAKCAPYAGGRGEEQPTFRPIPWADRIRPGGNRHEDRHVV